MGSDLELPDQQKLTVGWLIKHVPMAWWAIIFALLGAVFSFGYTSGKWFNPDPMKGSASELVNLEARKSELKSKIQELASDESELIARIRSLKAKAELYEKCGEDAECMLRDRGWLAE